MSHLVQSVSTDAACQKSEPMGAGLDQYSAAFGCGASAPVQAAPGSSPHSPGLFLGALRVPCVLPQVRVPGGSVCSAEAAEELHRQLLRVHLPALFQAN